MTSLHNYSKPMMSSWYLIFTPVPLPSGCLSCALFNQALPAAVNAEALVPVHQLPWALEEDVHGFLDQQDSVGVCLIQYSCLLPKGLVVLESGMLSSA